MGEYMGEEMNAITQVCTLKTYFQEHILITGCSGNLRTQRVVRNSSGKNMRQVGLQTRNYKEILEKKSIEGSKQKLDEHVRVEKYRENTCD